MEGHVDIVAQREGSKSPHAISTTAMATPVRCPMCSAFTFPICSHFSTQTATACRVFWRHIPGAEMEPVSKCPSWCGLRVAHGSCPRCTATAHFGGDCGRQPSLCMRPSTPIGALQRSPLLLDATVAAEARFPVQRRVMRWPLTSMPSVGRSSHQHDLASRSHRTPLLPCWLNESQQLLHGTLITGVLEMIFRGDRWKTRLRPSSGRRAA
jgi:hypothetical protein